MSEFSGGRHPRKFSEKDQKITFSDLDPLLVNSEVQHEYFLDKTPKSMLWCDALSDTTVVSPKSSAKVNQIAVFLLA